MPAAVFPDLTKRPAAGGIIIADELREDLEHGRGLIDAAISDRTRTAYDYEFKRFEQWVARHQLTSLLDSGRRDPGAHRLQGRPLLDHIVYDVAP
jgi:hypothetical protein